MSTDTVLTDDQIEECYSDKRHAFARAIEQAVLQSAQVQAWREAEDVLRRNGFVKCDIPACNCGSWHARYGLPERMQEIKDALAEAGHPLSNDNGNLAINALSQLIKESQAWKRDAERLDWLEEQAQTSRTGVSIDYVYDAEDGYEKGYRFMRHRFIGPLGRSAREAIDHARRAEGDGG